MSARHDHGHTTTAVLALLVTALFVASLAAGRTPVPVGRALTALVEQDPSLIGLVVQQIRLPRALLALLIGATLGLAGAALQGLLRNPLAEPGVIGVSGAAAFGSVCAFYSGAGAALPLLLPVSGMAGALVAVVFIFALAGRESSILTLVLAGVAVNSAAGALTALALNLSPNPFAAFEIFFWLMGSLADRSMEHVALAVVPMLAGWALLLCDGRTLDALTLGEDAAQSLGFDLRRVRLRIVAGTALGVGAAVSVSGIIGFVGLVVPHLLRPLVGSRPGALLPVSALGGAALTLAADVAVRFIGNGPELKLGVLTALLGAPFFFHLVWKHRRAVG